VDAVNPFRRYDLIKERQLENTQTPFAHQHQALDHLRRWFASAPGSNAGGIVVLPTGGGKTFTAIRFLCTSVIAEGYKVLWLAHTHHLLDQAFTAFDVSVGTIPETKTSLSTRVVSGTPGHDQIHRVEPSDDVVVATLQTVTLAFQNHHPSLAAFLAAAGDRLCVVFDEAHHSPAPSYRRLLKAMRAGHTRMVLIGLTATPTYTDVRKQGWLKELFPQGIVHQSKARDLLADGILARPNFEKISTEFSPDFDEGEYRKWVDTYRDLPEDVIEALASNRDRNALIADHYVRNRERYGRTIIFAERWFQCEQIESFLDRHGVRAGSVYSRRDARPSTAEGRNARTADENRRTLGDFKAGRLDVLLNVKMLTEGTDVPQTRTVFITRQTTSTILLTQMVGRALRGPRAGGTKEAFIVSFEDNWKHKINWADFDQLAEGPLDDGETGRRPSPPVRLISIDLVRRLADQMNSGTNVAPAEFLRLMPVGWYRVEFQALAEGTAGVESEDIETVRHLVMVFEDQCDGFRQLLEHLPTIDLGLLGSERVTAADVEGTLGEWAARFFPDQREELSRVDHKDLFHLARHVAQNEGELPQFFAFGERELYDLDAVAGEHLHQDLSQRRVDESLKAEFQRRDRFWMTLYPRYELFKTQYDACVNRILNGPAQPRPLPPPADPPPDREPSEELKAQVKSRDGHRCLCCGETKRSRLQVDHIAPWYFGGKHTLENLETLCRMCNLQKGITNTNFRIHCDQSRVTPSSEFPTFRLPGSVNVGDPDLWAQAIRRAVNFFYGAAAVEGITIGRKGRNFHEWSVRLFDGNQASWLDPHLPHMLDEIRSSRSEGGFGGPDGIRVKGSGGSEAAHFVSDGSSEGPSDFLGIPNGTECRLTIDGQTHTGVLRGGQLRVGRRGPFPSFSAASQGLGGRPGDAWEAWELRLPGFPDWVRAEDFRGGLVMEPEDAETDTPPKQDEEARNAHLPGWEGLEPGDLKVVRVDDQGVHFRWCPAGSFKAGSPTTEAGRCSDEVQVDVTLSRGFWMQETPVTQGLWKGVTGTMLGWADEGKTPGLPAWNVTHGEAEGFGARLTELLRQSGELPPGLKMSLPTEAQWEYAARAGTTTRFPFPGDERKLGDYAWYGENSGGRPLEVATRKPNPWGLYDMLGNVWEWCADAYQNKPAGGVDPRRTVGTSARVIRGGCYSNSPACCRPAVRSRISPGDRQSFLGFRLAVVLE